MESEHVATVRALYDAFNRRDLDGMVACFADEAFWTEHPTDATFKGKDELRAWMAGLLEPSSDVQISDVKLYEMDGTVITTFRSGGTNDGPIGSKPATGRYAAVGGCDIFHFAPDARIASGESFYDQLSILVQLGLAGSPEA
jgi:steroid delta-isomerase-like uncharacterized protein